MATWQATNVATGVVEKPKYNLFDTTELWVASIGSTVASADVVPGPVIPANSYVTDLVVDIDQLDTGSTVAFEVGYVTSTGTTSAAAFIASGNTVARSGGVVIPNVAATYGFSTTVDCTLQLQFTASPATGKAGKVRYKLTYNPNP